MSQVQEGFRERVRRLRLERGWTQDRLAELAKRHWTYIGGIERGERNVTIQVAADIAKALGVSVADLFAETEDTRVRNADKIGHPVENLFNASARDILEAISQGFRTRADVKGKLAELHLSRILRDLQARKVVSRVRWNDADDEPDFELTFERERIRIECKNTRSGEQYKRGRHAGWYKAEFQKTRRGIDPITGGNTRSYAVDRFDLVAVCLFNQTGRWEFLFSSARDLVRRPDNPNLLQVMQPVPKEPTGVWSRDIISVLRKTVQAA